MIFFKRMHMGFGQNAAVFSDLGFQRLQPGFEVREIMEQPDLAETPGRDAHAQLRSSRRPNHR